MIDYFIYNLKKQGKTKNSIKNYKVDVKQFVSWRNKHYKDFSYKECFPEYCSFLTENYSPSSIKRKVSSIRAFIEFVPIKRQTRSRFSNYLPYLSLPFSAASVLLLVSFATKPSPTTVEAIQLPTNMVVTTTREESFEDKNIQVAVSAPKGTETQTPTAIYTTATFPTYKAAVISAGEQYIDLFDSSIKAGSRIFTSTNDDIFVKVSTLEEGYAKLLLEKTSDQDVVIYWTVDNSQSDSFIF